MGPLPERERPAGTAPVAREVDELAADTLGPERTTVGVDLDPVVTPRLLRPDDPMALLRVRVVDVASRQPIAGVNVTFRTLGTAPRTSPSGPPEDQVVDVGLTGGDGIAIQMIPPGVRWEVIVAPEFGRAARIRSEPLAAGEEHDVLLEIVTAPDCVLHGRVIARDTNAPIPDAVVRIEPKHDVVATASDGTFRAEMRSWRDEGLEVRAPGYGPRWIARAPGHETPNRAIDVVLDHGAALQVNVLDPAGMPVSGAIIELRADNRALSPEPVWQGGLRGASSWKDETNSGGVARWTDLPSAVALDARVLRRGRVVHTESAPIVLEAGEQRVLTWHLAATSEVRGTVREENGEVAPRRQLWLQPSLDDRPTILRGASSAVGRRKAVSDAFGRFRFEDVTPGAWWIAPAEADFGRADPAHDPVPLGQRVEVPSTGAAVDVDVTLQRGLVVRGRVLGPDGVTPARSARGLVRAKRHGTGMLVTAQTTNDGEFTLGPLLPGKWTLAAMAPGSTVHRQSEDVEVDAGATNVVLRLRPAVELLVRVVDSQGEPVPSVEVRVTPERWPDLRGDSDADGRARIGGIPPGTVSVGCTLPDGRWGVAGAVPVAADAANEVEVVLQQGVRATFRLAGEAESAALVILRDGATVGGAVLEKGTVAAATLPVGRVLLRLQMGAKFHPDHEVTIAAGTTPEFTFDGAWR